MKDLNCSMKNEFNVFLVEFERQISTKDYEFEKYEVDDGYVYDFEQSITIYIIAKEEFGRLHVIFREILNTLHENDIRFQIIKFKQFCSRYVKSWITYYSFCGKKTKEFEVVNNQLKTIKLNERYELWKGYRCIFAGFTLEDDNEKGYALVKVDDVRGIVELREMSKWLLNSYVSFNIKNPYSESENKDIIKTEYAYSFYMNKAMRNILKKRYLTKYPESSLLKNFDIADLKGFYVIEFLKERESVPYHLFDNLINNSASVNMLQDIYTEKMKEGILNEEELKKEYLYVTVRYLDDLFNNFYYYISDNDSIKQGDVVLVNRGGEDTYAVVVDVDYYLGIDVPFPLNRTKHIIKKLEKN